MAHQYVKQLDEIVADAVFGNVGTTVSFRIGGADAEMLVKEFTPTFLEEDIVNLAKYQVILKLMIDGVASQPFSAATMRPIGSATGSADKVIRVSRERYAKHRNEIEDKIMRWSGMEVADGDDEDDGEEEKKPEAPVQPAPQKIVPAASAPQPREQPPREQAVSLKDLLPRPAPSAPRPSMPSPQTRPGVFQSGPQSQQQDGQVGGKKKRKRNRRKKHGGQPSYQPTAPVVPIQKPPTPPSVPVQKPPSPPPVPPTPPQPIKPGQTIQFD